MPLAVWAGSLHTVKLLEASGCGIDEMVLCEAAITLLECSDVKGTRDKEGRTTFSMTAERHAVGGFVAMGRRTDEGGEGGQHSEGCRKVVEIQGCPNSGTPS
ncbi:hypothetical protein Fmac_010093 [Flemingia macrophylla]|uniref:Uncharacterized protein n=1 Tax=Flemingia macrophylla TaxID=520843 RepID=A0ABD1N3E7_9FABA